MTNKNSVSRPASYVGVLFNDAAHGGIHKVTSDWTSPYFGRKLRAYLDKPNVGWLAGWGTCANYSVEFVEANRVN
jgi:hypothetical protein